MGKLLLLVAVLFAVVGVLRLLASSRAQSADDTKRSAPTDGVQTLLACPQCGVHMPADALAAHQASHRA
jgi:hypothetical protein